MLQFTWQLTECVFFKFKVLTFVKLKSELKLKKH